MTALLIERAPLPPTTRSVGRSGSSPKAFRAATGSPADVRAHWRAGEDHARLCFGPEARAALGVGNGDATRPPREKEDGAPGNGVWLEEEHRDAAEGGGKAEGRAGVAAGAGNRVRALARQETRGGDHSGPGHGQREQGARRELATDRAAGQMHDGVAGRGHGARLEPAARAHEKNLVPGLVLRLSDGDGWTDVPAGPTAGQEDLHSNPYSSRTRLALGYCEIWPIGPSQPWSRQARTAIGDEGERHSVAAASGDDANIQGAPAP